MSSNMDTVTNVETGNILANHEWVSVFPKSFNNMWADGELPELLEKTDNYSLSCGTSDSDIKAMMTVSKRIKDTYSKEVKMIMVDIANGYLNRLITVCA